MPWFKYGDYLKHCDQPCYDEVLATGSPVAYQGIYQCSRCSGEIVMRPGQRLPEHAECNALGKVGWRLIVFADSKPKWSGTLKNPNWTEDVDI